MIVFHWVCVCVGVCVYSTRVLSSVPQHVCCVCVFLLFKNVHAFSQIFLSMLFNRCVCIYHHMILYASLSSLCVLCINVWKQNFLVVGIIAIINIYKHTHTQVVNPHIDYINMKWNQEKGRILFCNTAENTNDSQNASQHAALVRGKAPSQLSLQLKRYEHRTLSLDFITQPLSIMPYPASRP